MFHSPIERTCEEVSIFGYFLQHEGSLYWSYLTGDGDFTYPQLITVCAQVRCGLLSYLGDVKAETSTNTVSATRGLLGRIFNTIPSSHIATRSGLGNDARLPSTQKYPRHPLLRNIQRLTTHSQLLYPIF